MMMRKCVGSHCHGQIASKRSRRISRNRSVNRDRLLKVVPPEPGNAKSHQQKQAHGANRQRNRRSNKQGSQRRMHSNEPSANHWTNNRAKTANGAGPTRTI